MSSHLLEVDRSSRWALIAFIPVAVELWFRNVHLVIALLAVLAIRRWPMLWVPAAAIKITPAVGVLYLAGAGKWRQAVLVACVGLVSMLVSVVLSPGAWADFAEMGLSRAQGESGGIVNIPFLPRFGVAALLAVAAGRLGGRRGEALIVIALLVGNPTLWVTAFSLLAALAPLLSDRRADSRLAASRLARQIRHLRLRAPH